MFFLLYFLLIYPYFILYYHIPFIFSPFVICCNDYKGNFNLKPKYLVIISVNPLYLFDTDDIKLNIVLA